MKKFGVLGEKYSGVLLVLVKQVLVGSCLCSSEKLARVQMSKDVFLSSHSAPEGKKPNCK